ncbi:MAG: hypothetical protein AVDCRST_MAG61-2815, partial [uncultured Friedmanniella sp.]
GRRTGPGTRPGSPSPAVPIPPWLPSSTC